MSPSSAKIEVPVIIDIPGIDVIEESCVMASSSIFLSNSSIWELIKSILEITD